MRTITAIAIVFSSCNIPSTGTTDAFEPPTTTGNDSTSTTGSTTEAPTTGGSTGNEPVKTCSPRICEDMAEWCTEHQISELICEVLTEKICPGNPCAACDIAASRCPFGATECKADAVELCYKAATCDCEYACDVPANMLTEHQRTALCYVYPWTIGKLCSEPDEALCMAVMSERCAPTACEYLACMEALEDEPCSVPDACASTHACLPTPG